MILRIISIIWIRRSPKAERSEKILTDQTELKPAYLSISKAKVKVKQFQRQPKKIQESDEILQEEDKEYLIIQNVDHHSDAVVNKTIKKDVNKHSTKCAGDNLDKSTNFIFDGSEKKDWSQKY